MCVCVCACLCVIKRECVCVCARACACACLNHLAAPVAPRNEKHGGNDVSSINTQVGAHGTNISAVAFVDMTAFTFQLALAMLSSSTIVVSYVGAELSNLC